MPYSTDIHRFKDVNPFWGGIAVISLNATYKWLALLILFAAALSGCASPAPQTAPTGAAVMDDPYHATSTGERLLKAGNFEAASQQFTRALEMNADYAPALTGLAKIAIAQEDEKAAFKYARKAAANTAAKSPERLLADETRMESYLAFKPGNWLADMEEIWEDAFNNYAAPASAALIMGRGYETADQYLKASVCFNRVLQWNGDHVKAADRHLQDMYRRLRAEPGSRVGRQMARQERISRGDLAAFLIEELKLPDYLESRKTKKYNAGFQTPQQFSQADETVVVPPDVGGHAFEADIATILGYEVRGLELFPDGLFHPDDAVNRAAFALVIEDILVRIKNEPLLRRAFVGSASPFPDVASSHYAFNAMVVCTTRDFLAADLDGAFAPDAPVSGAELLLAVRRLREEIKGRQVKY